MSGNDQRKMQITFYGCGYKASGNNEMGMYKVIGMK